MYHTMPVVDDNGKITEKRIASYEIKRIISSKVKEQKNGHTWWDEEVELKDGSVVKIRNVTRDGVFE